MEQQYDVWLVTLSVVMAVFASFTALGLASRIPHIEAAKSGRWLIGGAIAMGSGIWTMHFIGMLALHLPIPLAYDVELTLISVLIAIVGSALALYLMRNGIRGLGSLHASAALMAAAICAMHYTGMAALRMSPPIDYDSGLVLLSYIIAYLASLFALNVAFRSTAHSLLFSSGNLLGSVLMGFAIAGLHYVGMAAANFDPASMCLAAKNGLAGGDLAVVITSATLLILLGTVVLLVYDLQMAEQHSQMMALLRERNVTLQAEAAKMARAMMEQVMESTKRDRLLAAIVEQTGEAIIVTDLDGSITNWNPAATRMFGYAAEEVVGKHITLLEPHPRMSDEPGKEREVSGDYYVLRITKSGAPVYVSQTETPLHGEGGELTGSIVVMRDMSDEKRAHDQLMLWSMVYENSGEAIVITDAQNRILSVNRAFSDITGYEAHEVLGKDPGLLASGRHDAEFYKEMWRVLQRYGHWKGEVWNRRKNGLIYPEWLTITTLHDHEGKITNYIALFSDATEYKEKEARIEHMAQHDYLTGLPNRLLLEDRLSQAVIHARRRQEKVAVLFIDLDHFKMINDTLGHHVGDLLLQEVATRLSGVVRVDDTVSRQGGDEFIIVLNEISRVDDVAAVAQKIATALSQEYVIEDQSLRVTPSIGISMYPDDGNDIEELIKNADTAMYHAKESGRANYQFYTANLNAALASRMEMEQALRSAVEKQLFEIYYQPQVRLIDNKIIGVEALLRWFDPVKGAVPPDQFIPLAEESNLIGQIGKWVLKQAIDQLVRWNKPPLDALHIAVNVSSRQLDRPDFVEEVAALVAKSGIDPGRLRLEITETALMRDVNLTSSHLARLRDADIGVAVDDFGTGYSSLGYLKRFPISELKIDKTFISDIGADGYDEGIIRAIISLAGNLHLDVIAEGVETQEQAWFLREAGCSYAQGYLFARPMSLKDFEKFMALA